MDKLLSITLILGSTAACITAAGVIWSKIIGPWVARPVTKAVKRGIEEVVDDRVNPRLTAVELQVSSLQGIVTNGLSSDVRHVKEQIAKLKGMEV